MFATVVAYAIYILVEIGYVVKGLVASHPNCSYDPFRLVIQVVGYATDVVVYFKRHSASFAAGSALPFASVSGSPGCFEDEWLQTVVGYQQDAERLLVPLPDLQFVVYLHTVPHD